MLTELKPVRAWRAFYAPDLWHCGSAVEEATRLPDGVIVVVAYELDDWTQGQPYRRILQGSDWYFWAGEYVGYLGDFKRPHTSKARGGWLSNKPILKAFPDAVLKKGIWVDDDAYEATLEVARKAVSAP